MSDTGHLCDDDTAAVFNVYGIARPLPKSKWTGRKSRKVEATHGTNLDAAVKGRFRQLDPAVAADLLSIPPPSVEAVRSGQRIGCEQMRDDVPLVGLGVGSR